MVSTSPSSSKRVSNPRSSLGSYHRPGNVPHLWLPNTVARFDSWFLDHADVAAEVNDSLEAIALSPYGPPYPARPYEGDDLAHAFIASINDHVDVIFIIFRDQPYLGLVSILDYRDLSSP